MRLRMTVAAVLVVALATGALAMRSALAANVGVDVKDNFYQDGDGNATTTITAGDTVTWTFVGNATHTVTADDNAFDSGNMSSGTFQHTFNTPGTYGYYCQIHGAPGVQMFGTIVVQAAATATSTATAAAQSTATRTPTTGPTNTPAATGTAGASSTPAAPTSTPRAIADLAPPSTPAGGANPNVVVAPQAGDGGASRRDRHTALIVALLAVAGAAVIAGGALMRRSWR